MSYPEQSNPQRWYGEERDSRYSEPPYADQRPAGDYRPPEPRTADQQHPAEPAWATPRPEQYRSGEQQAWTPPAEGTPPVWDTPQPRAAESRIPEQQAAWTPEQRAGEQAWTPEQRPAEPAWTERPAAEAPTGGQRHQAERVPLLKGQPRPEQPTSGGFPTEQPAYDPPTTRVPTVVPDPARPGPGHPTEQVQLRRSEPSADGDGVYRSRRPVIAIGLAAVVGVLELVTLGLLGSSLMAKPIPASGVVAGVLLLLGLPVFAAGMYGMVTGAGRASERHGARILLRPPLSYLVIGLVLLVGAALAAG
ncbi:hypothetical protein [Longispora fulva]|uniref:Uncharacterized protein n=1 Tax=Longispora fulva TaxID=619741 RepID=A0A8J7GCT6_9ACTN|nr:hypothetical protein [Longispora fulva]MBG6138198.1 hypothetical protein [Longispora fulva]